MLSSPLGPMPEMFNAVPSAPQHPCEQVAQFGYAEPHLPVGSFFATRTQHRQDRMGQYGQGDVPVPTLPVANLVMIQSALALGGLKGLLDLPALSSHTGQGWQRGSAGGRVSQIVRILR